MKILVNLLKVSEKKIDFTFTYSQKVTHGLYVSDQKSSIIPFPSPNPYHSIGIPLEQQVKIIVVNWLTDRFGAEAGSDGLEIDWSEK